MKIAFVDRESRYPNRYKITKSNGSSELVTLERADDPVTVGTPLNAGTFNMMLPQTFEVRLLANRWSGGKAPYTQTVLVDGIWDSDQPHYGVIYSANLDTALAEKEAFAMVDDLDTATGSVTFTCFDEAPSINLNIQMEVNR